MTEDLEFLRQSLKKDELNQSSCSVRRKDEPEPLFSLGEAFSGTNKLGELMQNKKEGELILLKDSAGRIFELVKSRDESTLEKKAIDLNKIKIDIKDIDTAELGEMNMFSILKMHNLNFA